MTDKDILIDLIKELDISNELTALDGFTEDVRRYVGEYIKITKTIPKNKSDIFSSAYIDIKGMSFGTAQDIDNFFDNFIIIKVFDPEKNFENHFFKVFLLLIKTELENKYKNNITNLIISNGLFQTKELKDFSNYLIITDDEGRDNSRYSYFAINKKDFSTIFLSFIDTTINNGEFVGQTSKKIMFSEISTYVFKVDSIVTNIEDDKREKEIHSLVDNSDVIFTIFE